MVNLGSNDTEKNPIWWKKWTLSHLAQDPRALVTWTCDDSHVSRDMTCDIVMTVAQEAATRGQVGGGSNHTTADVLCHIMSAVHLYIIIKY